MPASLKFYPEFAKRWLDLVISSAALVALSPLLMAISLMVLLIDGRPVFFQQIRTGRSGKAFRIWKFRTMSGTPQPGETLVTSRDDDRITRLGGWLRRTKCDELPQLWNVVRGDMSLVGPRPEVTRYTDRYTEQQRLVLAVRPGITGPAANEYIGEEDLLAAQEDKEAYYVQVLLPAKLESDLEYVRRIAFNTDLKLIAKTISNLLLKSPKNSKTQFPVLGDSIGVTRDGERSRGAA